MELRSFPARKKKKGERSAEELVFVIAGIPRYAEVTPRNWEGTIVKGLTELNRVLGALMAVNDTLYCRVWVLDDKNHLRCVRRFDKARYERPLPVDRWDSKLTIRTLNNIGWFPETRIIR